jgi:DNA-binding NtrC family response regulator
MDAIIRYDWPGNVRALRHALERAVILSEGDQFELTDFQLDAQPNQPGALVVPGQTSTREAAAIPAGDASDDLNLERLEKRAIEKALQQHRYNISHAARELGLTRAALYRRMDKHGL